MLIIDHPYDCTCLTLDYWFAFDYGQAILRIEMFSKMGLWILGCALMGKREAKLAITFTIFNKFVSEEEKDKVSC